MQVTRQMPALWNGVSQQPAPVRLSSQCESQVNCTSSVVDGVRKRGPTEHIRKLSTTKLTTAYLHTINRDRTERYEVVITPTGIRVFDMLGNEKTVTAPLGWSYLSLPSHISSRKGYAAMTVADYTFVLNKTKRVALLPAGADLDPPTAEYWWLNRSVSSSVAMAAPRFREPREPIRDFDADDRGFIDAVAISTQAAYKSNPTGTLTGEVQTLQDLPGTAANGAVYKIIGNSSESAFQSYYVIRQSGGWYETVKPGLQNLIDAKTMPHALIRQGDGTFIFGPFAWAARHVGDDATNPHPTFVGRALRDMFFYRNRLGFCVDENVVLSRAGAFDTFHRLTVVDFLPDEVVDIAASQNKVTRMEFAVPFQGSMMLFSDQTQFQLNHREVFAAGTVSLDVTTEYPLIPGVRPTPSGSDVYFPSDGSGWGAIREYFVNTDGITNDAADVTAHVQQYIPFGIHTLAASSEFNSVFVLTDGAPNRIYTYQYYWQSETEKAQSAWHFWEFQEEDTILAAQPLGGWLYLLIDRADGTYLERMPMFYGGLAAGLEFQVYLDRRCVVEGVYDEDDDVTTFTLPYELPEVHRDFFRCVLGSEYSSQGAALTHTWTSPTTFTVLGRFDAGPAVCGTLFTSQYTFSRQYPQNSKGEAIHTGRLQLKTFSVYFHDTSYFRAVVRPYGAESQTIYTKEFPTRRVGVLGMGVIQPHLGLLRDENLNVIVDEWGNGIAVSAGGPPPFVEGKATIAVQANAAEAFITLENDTYLGFCFDSAEWEGFYHNRARA